MYDDYRELRPGAAKKLEDYLENVARQRAGDQGISRTDRMSVPNSSHRASMKEHRANTTSHISTHSLSQTYSPPPGYTQANPTIVQCEPEGQWLLVCAQAKKSPTSLSQIDVCSVTSDKELFRQLKRTYLNLKGKWSHLLSLRTIKSIRFVQVRHLYFALTSFLS